MKCIVLAGGGGLRLWPLSTKKKPKQFLSLVNENSMLCNTIERNIEFCDEFLVLTNKEHENIARDELLNVNVKNRLILETIGRNTAPAIAIAAMLCDKDDVLFVVPADSYIANMEKYSECVKKAEILAENGSIVTFGIKPTNPHTGYGYIKYEGNDVLEFKEKPSLEIAQDYLSSGEYLWNSGMFMFKASTLLAELKNYREDIYLTSQALVNSLENGNAIILPEGYMKNIPSESIDYAVMEKSDKIKVIASDFKWNDIGGLEALVEFGESDSLKNIALGENIIINNSSNSAVINKNENTLVVINEMSDIIVTVSDKSIYVTKKEKSQNIKEIISENKEKYSLYFD